MEGHHLGRRMLLLQVNDRAPGVGAPAPIDLFDEAVDFIVEESILAYVGAAGDADLDEYDLFAIFGGFFKETVKGVEAFGNALGVVDPVDADANRLFAQTDELAPALHLGFNGGVCGHGLVSVEIDADGEGADNRHLAAARYFEAFIVYFGFQGAVDGIEKVFAVIAQVEAEQIVA